ncbi:MAG TPA: hypothetical protein VME45_06465 [Stellaceae bacterium]|nr:hypothetical protein [Stellaceae bacterium]
MPEVDLHGRFGCLIRRLRRRLAAELFALTVALEDAPPAAYHSVAT